MGRTDDVIALARATLDDGGGQFVEETYYYGGLARQAKGETDRAIDNFNGAITFNPNHAGARGADQLMSGGRRQETVRRPLTWQACSHALCERRKWVATTPHFRPLLPRKRGEGSLSAEMVGFHERCVRRRRGL
ncbi:MAG: hypothetical protein IPK19_26355 [Chloroflexi bacterium]|nr:hypothetical protein [Chloroflexota bacterium]